MTPEQVEAIRARANGYGPDGAWADTQEADILALADALEAVRALCEAAEANYGKGTDFDLHGAAQVSVRDLRAIVGPAGVRSDS